MSTVAEFSGVPSGTAQNKAPRASAGDPRLGAARSRRAKKGTGSVRLQCIRAQGCFKELRSPSNPRALSDDEGKVEGASAPARAAPGPTC